MKWTALGFLGLLLVGLLVWVFLWTGDDHLLGGLVQPKQDTDVTRIVLGYALTLVGVVIGTAFRKIKELEQAGQKTIQNFRQLAADILRSTDLWMGFCAAPIVAGIVLTTASDIPIYGFALIALQNGFFCQAVIERLQAPKSEAKRASRAR